MMEEAHNQTGAKRPRSPRSVWNFKFEISDSRPIGLVTLLTLLGVIVFGPRSHAEQPARYAAQLARECDELLALVVKRPYGWAWTQGEPDPRPKGGAQTITLQPPGTAG